MVATILLLSLTVVLFAALFAFVTRFPSPPAQSTDQFQASLVIASNLSITGLTIVHLAGPSVSLGSTVYLQSSVVGLPNRQFSTSGMPLAWGLKNTTLPWNLGQVWTTTFGTNHTNPVVPGNANITVFIVSNNQLIFSVILGNSGSSFAPTILSSGTTPAPAVVGKTFVAYVQLGGDFVEFNSTNPLKINFAAVPGLPTVNETMNTTAGTGYWSTTVAAGKTTTNGTYYAFVTGSSGVGSISGEVTIVVSGASSGGGGSGQLSVSDGINWTSATISFPPVPSQPANFWATVTYSGSSTGVPLNVTFYLNETSPFTGVAAISCVYYAPSSTVIGSTPSTITVYSTPKPSFTGGTGSTGSVNCPASGSQYWISGDSDSLTALAKAGGLTAHASVAILPVSLQGLTVATNSTAPTLPANQARNDHTCHTTNPGANCPYLTLEVWNNWTAQAVKFNGTVVVTNPGGTKTTYTVGDTSIAGGATSGWINVLTNTTTGTTRWGPTTAGTWTIATYIVVRSTAAGTPIVGYIDLSETLAE